MLETNEKFNQIIDLARLAALDCGALHIAPIHLLSAFLYDYDNNAIKVLKSLDFDMIQLRTDIDNMIDFTDYSDDIDDIDDYKVLPFNSNVGMMVNLANHEAKALGDYEVGSDHLMLAMLSVGSVVIDSLIVSRGVNYKTFKYKIREIDMEGKFDTDDFEELKGGKNKGKFKRTKSGSNTPILDNFSSDITKSALEGKIDPIIGQDKEIERVSQILSRKKKNNPILIGYPGVGKSAIVEGLALRIKDGKAPRTILNKRIVSLDLASMVAGTKYRGQFEERMKSILEGLEENDDIILFIDEIHTMVGAGNASGSLDASNILKPALARGDLQCIGATTLDEYRENIEKDGALQRRFQKVMVNPPSVEETLTILQNVKPTYEDYHKVEYTDAAVESCVKLAERFITDREFPDKALDIMDEVGARSQVHIKPPKHITKLEDRISEIHIEKQEIVKQQKYEKAAELRDEERKLLIQLDAAKARWKEELNEKRRIITAEDVAEVVAMSTGIPVTKISEQENKKILNMAKVLKAKVIGQDDAIMQVTKAIKRNRVGIKDPNKPIGSFIFLGPTGVGKTQLTKELANEVFGSEEALIRVDMSEYMEKFSTTKLIGSPPGYVGHDEGGQLTEKVKNKPYSVVLFDEIEKAHPDIFNMLLQILDEGHITDGLGRKINFKNTLIVMTSNIGIKNLQDFGEGLGFSTAANQLSKDDADKAIIEKSLKKAFAPEFLNRLDDIIFFKSLTKEHIGKIVDIPVGALKKRIAEVGYDLRVNKSAREYLVEKGYDSKFGARPLNRAVQRYIEDPVAEKMLETDLEPGSILKVSYDKKTDKMKVKVDPPKN